MKQHQNKFHENETGKEGETWSLKCPFWKYPMCLISTSNNSLLNVEQCKKIS